MAVDTRRATRERVPQGPRKCEGGRGYPLAGPGVPAFAGRAVDAARSAPAVDWV